MFNSLNSLKRKISKPKKKSFLKYIKITELIEERSVQIINLVGYVLLILTLLDFVVLLVPPKLFNPEWELDVMGRLIETVWAPLFGFILIFFRQKDYFINTRELKVLSFLSWLSLLLGLIYFLTIPLLINDAIRIRQNNQAQYIAQVGQQTNQVKQFEQRLTQTNDEQLNTLLDRYKQQANNSNSTIISPQQLREQLLNSLKTEQESNKKQLELQAKQKNKSLFKTLFKWVIGAIISGFSFIVIWKSTKWSRVLLSINNQSTEMEDE